MLALFELRRTIGADRDPPRRSRDVEPSRSPFLSGTGFVLDLVARQGAISTPGGHISINLLDGPTSLAYTRGRSAVDAF